MSCEKQENLNLPKDAKMICSNSGEVRGIITNDGSFDFTPEGQEFLTPNQNMILDKPE